MNLLLDLQIVGWLLVGLGCIELIPTAMAFAYGEPALPYAASAAAALAYGLPMALSLRPADRRMRTRDGFVAVSASWALASVFGALPYVLTGTLSPVDSLFESVSGFTTTGSTVLTHIEGTPHALLLWRSISQWLGGMGIIVVTIAVLPLLGIGGMQLFKAEMPGPVADKLTPRIAVTARRLWSIYVAITLGVFVCLWIAGMGPFDALCHALTTTSTGGFSTRDASIGAFDSAAIEWILIVFMLVSGVNFALHYRILLGEAREVVRNSELRIYLALVIGMTIALTWLLHGSDVSDHPVRNAAFSVAALVTTTGYTTVDFNAWPSLARFLVLPMLVVGGMAGSTSGGIKVMRLELVVQVLRTFFLRASHRSAVRLVRHEGRPVAEDVVNAVLVFLFAYIAMATLTAGVLAGAGYDIETSITSALTALGNVGPGLGRSGPTNNFAHFPASAKLMLSFSMLAGRLELFTLLVIFQPSFWRR